MTHDPSRLADQNRSRRSCPPELLWIRAGWQRALTSSAGSQTTPVESPPQRSVPGSALTPPAPPGPGWMESKAGASSRHPSEFPLSVPLGSIRLLHQLLAKLLKKLLRSSCFHCRKRHSVYSRSSVIGLG